MRVLFVLVTASCCLANPLSSLYRSSDLPLVCESCKSIPQPSFPARPGTQNDYLVNLGNLTSYSGFFTTQPKTNNNMFWWFFPSQDGNKSAPTLIWLQGGPGGSSLFGLFNEMGPWSLSSELELVDRPSSWNKHYSMIFIDNPVGAGFSYTTQDAGYCQDSVHDVASNLYSLLEQFYTVFPEQLSTPLYITGESYAGHYIPAIAFYIHTQNQASPNIKMPLEGVAIGDGWVDPIEQMKGYPEQFFNTGLADTKQRQQVQEWCDQVVNLISNNQYTQAFEIWDAMLNGDIFPYGNYFHNITGCNNYDNFLRDDAPESFDYYALYLNQEHIREAIHVGDAVFNDGSECEKHLVGDFMKSLKPELEVLLDNYKVLVYSGQLDVIIGAPLTQRFLLTTSWSGQEEYLTADRMVWRIHASDPHVAGFVRVVNNFQQVLVRSAGHILPFDQPERSLDMINRFVQDIPYENLPNPIPSHQPKTVHSHITSSLQPAL